ncbi:hypothetical protein GCN74_03415 [Janthinobacterium sp. FT14W]|uniref:hypothetical protein n=1 Tax=Janthinobacterium sp. FT14W TaxID=2654253 RepID=UPI0012655DB9|nr:hypothetical protein [Janthinobacterium sp. FT14W]KAB8062089.1 hypothetical protein GCN74_03415 [Janthinobacterium sp. FT14W]
MIPRLFLLFSAVLAAPAAHAETWQCTDAATGRAYTVSQAVPADACKLLSSTKNPHFTGPAVSEQPVPVSMRRPHPCSKMAAQEVQFGIREFAKWQIEGDHLAVHWVYAIEKQPEAKRLQMITTYADMDACLGGATRGIMFYRKGKLMGMASPTSGVRLIQ